MSEKVKDGRGKAHRESTSPARIIHPPNRIAAKVRKRPSESPDLRIERAERVITRLAGEFVETLATEIESLEELARSYRKDRSPEVLGDLSARIHNIRGQGTTFGYPLITEICKSFGNYLQDLPEDVSASIDVVSHHVAAMRAIYRGAVINADDEAGIAVLSALHALVSKERKAMERSC